MMYATNIFYQPFHQHRIPLLKLLLLPLVVVLILLNNIQETHCELATFEINPRHNDNNNNMPASILNRNRQMNYLDVLLADQSKRGKIFDRTVSGLKDPVDVVAVSDCNQDNPDNISSTLSYIFVSQFMSNQVLKISPHGVSTLFAKGVYCSDRTKPCSVLDGPWGLEHFENKLFISSFSSDQILVFNITTGGYIYGFGNSVELNCPEGMTLGGDGYLYVVSYLNNEIVRYNPVTYEYVDVIVKAGTISGPEDVIYLHSNNFNYLIVTSHWSNSILIYNASTTISSSRNNDTAGFELLHEYGPNQIGHSLMQGPVGLLKYDESNILVSLQGDVNKILKINIENGKNEIFAEYKYMKGPSG
jgi:hypothetical protein